MLTGNASITFTQAEISARICSGETLRAVAWVSRRTARSQCLTCLGNRQWLLQLNTRQSSWLMSWTPVVQIALICTHGSTLAKVRCSYLECSRRPKTNKGRAGSPPRLLRQTLMLLPIWLSPPPLLESFGPASYFVVSCGLILACPVSVRSYPAMHVLHV